MSEVFQLVRLGGTFYYYKFLIFKLITFICCKVKNEDNEVILINTNNLNSGIGDNSLQLTSYKIQFSVWF